MTSERESLVQMKKSTENKVIPQTQLALQVEASTQTLPDESDLIIHELNQKLNSLRQQLVNYESQRQQANRPSPRQLRAQLAKQEAQLQDLQAERQLSITMLDLYHRPSLLCVNQLLSWRSESVSCWREFPTQRFAKPWSTVVNWPSKCWMTPIPSSRN